MATWASSGELRGVLVELSQRIKLALWTSVNATFTWSDFKFQRLSSVCKNDGSEGSQGWFDETTDAIVALFWYLLHVLRGLLGEIGMSAFYLMRYAGTAGQGGGALYIGKGIIVGVDVLGGKYEGSYTERDGRLRGTVKLTAPRAGAHLVTGQTVTGGQSFDLRIDLPEDFANGRPQTIIGVGGRPVQVTFEKLKNLP